jgi:hypothetical protein
MKLNELAAPKPSKQISKVFESYFGNSIKFDQLDRRQATYMLNKVRGILGEHRNSIARHRSERDPAYLQLVMMESALTARIKEETIPVPPPTTGGTITPTSTSGSSVQVKDPKLAAALKKSTAGQSLNPEEQKLVAGAAMMKAESRLRRAMQRLNESEVQQAQVVLAAQDMVDKMQGMLEDVTELQFKELPALVDSIKNQVGMEQAQQFNTDATAALAGLVGNLQGAKQQLDSALNVVTGAAPATAGVDAAADAAMAGADMAAAGGADMAAAGADMAAVDDLAADDLAAELPEPGAEPTGAALGRSKR